MKIFSTLLVLLLLSGCSLFSNRFEDKRPAPVVTIHRTLLAYECPQPPQLDTFVANDIEWDVASRKELDAILLELMFEFYEGDDDPFEDEEFLILVSIINQEVGNFFFHPDDEVRWSLSAEDYAGSGKNLSDGIKALKQMKSVIIHYKKCIADSKDVVRRANEQATVEVPTE